MPFNPKSLKNLTSNKERYSEKERKEISSRGGKNSKKNRDEKKRAKAEAEAQAQRVADAAVALLNRELPKDLKKDLKDISDSPDFRAYLLAQLIQIAAEGKDSDRINAVKTLFEYAREDPDYEIKNRELDIKKQRADNEDF